jgi:hypothetical protein
MMKAFVTGFTTDCGAKLHPKGIQSITNMYQSTWCATARMIALMDLMKKIVQI